MEKRMLVTGANGFLGNHVYSYFSKDYKIIGIDVYCNKVMDIEFYTVDMSDGNLSELYKKINPNVIIHCAGSAHVASSLQDPLHDFDSNVYVLYKMLVELKEAGVFPRIVTCSSAAVYGNPQSLPVMETHLLNPISPYGLHKKMCEDVCRYFIKQYGFDIKILRIFSAYGEGLRKQIFWDMYQKYKENRKITLYGTGSETRDFIHVDDIVGQMEAIINSNDEYDTYNVASGNEVSINDLALLFAKKLGLTRGDVVFNRKMRDGDPDNWLACTERTRELGYRNMVNLEEGVSRYIDWITTVPHKS